MADYKRLALAATQALKLDDDLALLQSLGELAANWKQLSAEIDGIGSLEEFLTRLATEIHSLPVKQAFHKLGLDPLQARLEVELGRLVELVGGIPSKYRLLLEPLGSFEDGDANRGQVAWTITAPAVGLPASGQYALDIKGSAGFTFEAGDIWPFAGDAVADRFLRIGAAGSIAASAEANVPYQFLAIGASASSSTEAVLDYYFRAPSGETLYAFAAAEHLASLPDPFDFDAVWDAAAKSNLAGIVYRFKGAAAASLEVSFADTADVFAGVTLDLGASVGVTVAIDSEYCLSFRAVDPAPGGGPELLATLSRSDARSRSLSGALGIKVDLSALGLRVHEILKKAVARWGAVLDEIKPYLTPGTWLQDQAADLLGNAARSLIGRDALRAALLRDVRGLIGIDSQSDSELAGWLTAQLAAAVDRASGALVRPVGQGVDAAIGELGKVIPAFAQAEVEAILRPALEALINTAQRSLEATVDGLFQHQKNALGEALQDAGVAIGGAVEKADDALTGVRALIASYDALFGKILNASKEAATARLTARLSFEEARTSGSDYQLRGTFTARSAANAQVFAALVEGRLDGLKAVIDNPAAAPDVAIDRKRSALTRFAASESRLGFEMVLLDFGVESSTILKTDSAVMVDGQGRVRIDSSANLKRRFEGLDETRELTFVDSFALAVEGAQRGLSASDKRSIELGLDLVTRDKSLSRAELATFIAGLAAARLLPADAGERADAQLTKWMGPGQAQSLSADVAVKLWLGTDSLASLMQLSERGQNGLSEAAALRIIDIGLRALEGAGAIDRKRLRQGAAIAMQDYRPREERLSLAEAIYHFPKRWRGKIETVTGSRIPPESERQEELFRDEAGRINRLVTLVQQMGDVYLAVPAAAASPGTAGWTEADYRDAQERMSNALKPWFAINRKFVFWVKSAAHPRTIALFRAISDLAGHTGVAPLSLIITNRTPDGQAETAVIV